MKAQEWLDKKYPKESRKEIREIYLNEPLEGDLDLGDFATKEWLMVYIYAAVYARKIKIKNLPQGVKIVKLLSAQTWLDENYPKNGVCQRATDDKKVSMDEEGGWNNYGKTRTEITKLDFSLKNLEGELDLSDFINLEKLNCSFNQLTNLGLSKCFQLTELNCRGNLLTSLTLPTNPTNLKELNLSDNNFPAQDLSFLVPYTSLERLELENGIFAKYKIQQDTDFSLP